MNYNNNNYQDNHNIDHSDNHDDNHTISMDGKAASNTTTTTSDNHDGDVSKVDINKVLCHLPTSAKYVLLKDILGSEDYNGNVMMMMIIIIIIIILYIKDGVHGLY